MTFNIRHSSVLDGANRWYNRRDMVFSVVRAHAPHVLGMQEVDPHQLHELLDEFPTFGAIADGRYGGLIGAYAPILFDKDRLESGQSGHFWLAPDPSRKRRAWDAAVARICTWGVFKDTATGRRFAVLNSHFDQRGVEARRHSAGLVVERLRELDHVPRMFMADLNANEESEPLQILKDAGLRDSFRELHPDSKPFFTYHRFRGLKSRGVLGKIDYILVDDAWTVLEAAIVRTEFEGRLPSDHYPVTADLALK
jgi:endonuclease/exonuclease/phosphatase family metal-dependent hydrolase